MGFQTSVLILNDAIDSIKDDKELGEKLYYAVLHQSMTHEPITIPSGCHANPITVIESHHADNNTIVAFGGNCGQVLGHVMGWDYDLRTETGKENMLRELADTMGYRIVKKR